MSTKKSATSTTKKSATKTTNKGAAKSESVSAPVAANTNATEKTTAKKKQKSPFTDGTKRVARDATEALTFTIGSAEVETAICGDPNSCVIAQAIHTKLGDLFDGIEVGATITKLAMPGHEIRFATPAKLRKAIINFDKTGKWDLEPGEYRLNPPSKTAKLKGRKSRWNNKSKKKTAPGRDVFKARAMPTRKISRSAVVAPAANQNAA